MTKSRLELRSMPMIGLALVVGPVVGLSYFWVIEVVLPGSAASTPGRTTSRAQKQVSPTIGPTTKPSPIIGMERSSSRLLFMTRPAWG